MLQIKEIFGFRPGETGCNPHINPDPISTLAIDRNIGYYKNLFHSKEMGAKTLEQMRENLSVLEKGPMSEEELARMRKIGDHIYGRKDT